MSFRDTVLIALAIPIWISFYPSHAHADSSDGIERANAAQRSANPSLPSGQLPTGDDGNFRKKMLDWNAPPSVPTKEALEATRPLGFPLRNVRRFSSYFGMRADPLGMGFRMHSGVDIPGRLGANVMATEAGVVIFAGWAGDYGNLVIIDHGNGLQTRYGHLLRSLVTPGERIDKSIVIGLLGSTGRSTGAHLHYEVRISGSPVNPLGARIWNTEVPPPSEYVVPTPPATPRWDAWKSVPEGQLPMSKIR